MDTPAAPRTEPSARPLIVRIRNWVGDVVLGVPALRLIESQGYRLEIVARGKWAPALLAGEGWPVHVQPARVGAKIEQLRELRRQCRREDPRFDRRENALVMPESFSSALEMRLAGLRAVGYGKEGRTPLLARAEPITLGGHALISYWELACRFLKLKLDPPADIDLHVAPAKAAEAERLLAAHGIEGDFVLVCPFAAGLATAAKLNKKWPAFGEFAARAGAELGLALVVYPGPGEHALARELYPAATMIEGSDLAVYAALLQRAALVVANDTGPGHMAAALGTPLLSVLGPTIAVQWAPWGPRVTVMQRPGAEARADCDWPSADEVLAAARDKLARGRRQ
jgi:heptosyltransferase II